MDNTIKELLLDALAEGTIDLPTCLNAIAQVEEAIDNIAILFTLARLHLDIDL